MKVTFVVTGLNIGGAELMLYSLIRWLRDHDVQCEVIGLKDPGNVYEMILKLGVPVKSLNPGNRFPFWSGLLRLRKELVESKPDLIQGWMYHGNLLAKLSLLFSGHPIPIIWGIRYSLTNLDNDKWLTRQVIKWGKRFSRSVLRIVYNSKISRDQHEKFGYAQDKSHHIPNGIDTEKWKPDRDSRDSLRRELGLPFESFLIGHVGRWDPAKDHMSFLVAASQLIKMNPQVHFVLAGQDVDNKNPVLMEQVTQLGIDKNIHMLGLRRDIPSIMAGLDVLTSSSMTEAFPNVVLEAMACGIPSVVTNVGDSADMVADTGLVVEPKRPDLLCQAWKDILKLSPEDRLRMGQDARDRVIKEFDINEIASRYKKLYSSLLGV